MVTMKNTLDILILIPVLFTINVESAKMQIFPTAFLPNVTDQVVFTCQPTGQEDISHLLLLQIEKRQRGSPDIPVASFVINESPMAESLGLSLNVVVSGLYNASHPHRSMLSMMIPWPNETAEGEYLCVVEAIDSNGLAQRHTDRELFYSLSGIVPDFFESVLQEMKQEIVTLSSDLNTLNRTHELIIGEIGALQSHLGTIDSRAHAANQLVVDVNSILTSATHREQSMRDEVQRLEDVTPSTKVYFNADVSVATYVTINNGDNVIFDTVRQSLASNYSATTGVFTAPISGTYLFITGITGLATAKTYVSVVVGNDVIASAYANDDYTFKQSTATAVIWVAAGEQVRIVNKSGAAVRIYGVEGGEVANKSYFLGILLW